MTDESAALPPPTFTQVHEMLQYNIDRRMSEQQARASLYFAVERFGASGRTQQQKGDARSTLPAPRAS